MISQLGPALMKRTLLIVSEAVSTEVYAAYKYVMSVVVAALVKLARHCPYAAGV